MTSKRLLAITSLLWLGSIVAVSPAVEQVSSTDSADIPRSVNENIHELWRANIEALPSETSDSQVDEVIQKIRTIQLTRKPEGRSPQVPLPIPDASPQADAPPQESQAQTLPDKLPSGRITPQTLIRLKKAAPEAFADPAELADALFTNGNLQAAGHFYQVNLKRDLTAEDKAWTLLQIGNCLVSSDPAGAEKSYQDLLTDFPNSPWSPLAEVKLKLIEWHKLNNPQAVLKSLESVLKSPANTQSSTSSKSTGQQTALNQTESP